MSELYLTVYEIPAGAEDATWKLLNSHFPLETPEEGQVPLDEPMAILDGPVWASDILVAGLENLGVSFHLGYDIYYQGDLWFTPELGEHHLARRPGIEAHEDSAEPWETRFTQLSA